MSEATVRAYYEAIDGDDYEALADLLAPDVIHERPDRTIEGRETLVAFMREGRPNRHTTHEVDRVYSGEDGEGVAVEGQLFDADGDRMFAFVDAFSLREGDVERIRTYTG